MDETLEIKYFNQTSFIKFLRKQFDWEGPYNAYMWRVAPYSFVPRHAITGLFVAGVCSGLPMTFVFPWINFIYWATLTIYVVLATVAAIDISLRNKSVSTLLFLPFSFLLFHFFHGAGVLVGATKVLFGISPIKPDSSPFREKGGFRAWP